MVSAITNQGKVHWMIVEGGVNVEKFLAFLDALIRDAHHKVFLILDNLKVHHSKLVTEWVEARKDKIELVFLPAYSPDLNPEENESQESCRETFGNAERLIETNQEIL